MPEQRVPRKLSLFDATMLVMGAILGVGIFFNPSQVAGLVPSTAAFFGAWGIGCVVALCGAFTFAEWAATFPHAGGSFVYLREVYGRPVAFLLAWVVLLVISTGALSAMAGFGSSMIGSVLASADPSSWLASIEIGAEGSLSHGLLSSGIIVGLTLVALGGTKVGATFQNACMAIKLGLVLTLIVAGLLLFAPVAPLASAAAAPELAPVADSSLLKGMTLAMLPVLFACGGWPLVAYISTEVKDPTRNIPRALVLGVFGVTVLYLLLNAAYLRVVGIDYIAQNGNFVSEVVARSFGGVASRFVSGALAISALGVSIVTVVTTPWLYVAMAREKLFFGGFAKLHQRTGAPVLGLLLQCALAIGYVWYSNTQFLVDAVVFVEWFFHVLTAFGLLWIRAKRPELPRPFCSFAYPLMPLVYGVFALGLLIGVIWQGDPVQTRAGLGVFVAGIVIYPFWRKVLATRA